MTPPHGALYWLLEVGDANIGGKRSRGVQPGAREPHASQDGHECGPTQIVNLLKTLRDCFVIMCHNIFNVWPKTTLLLPVWPRDAKRLDTPAT